MIWINEGRLFKILCSNRWQNSSSDFDKNVNKENQIQTKGIEVGHIFTLEINIQSQWNVRLIRYNKTFVKMDLELVSRLVGAIIKLSIKMIRWSGKICFSDVVIIPSINKNDNSNIEKAHKIYNQLQSNGVDVVRWY